MAIYAVYNKDLQAYNTRLADFKADYDVWYKNAYSNPAFVQKEQEEIDQLILDEQALELVFEGNRYYDLMRRAYWYGDNSRLANPVSKRDAATGAKLMNQSNWFLKWKDKIGL